LVEARDIPWRNSLFLESLYTGRDNPFQEGIRKGKWKYIRMYDGVARYDESHVDFVNRTPEFEMLFDLEADPAERDNLIESHADSPTLASLRIQCADESQSLNRRREAFRRLVQAQRRDNAP
jgi:hypothetical protein